MASPVTHLKIQGSFGRRNIDENMYKDVWFRDLPMDRKLAWFGMISFLADDQGRFLIDTKEMRHVLFGGDITVSDDTIMNIVNEFAMAGKVIYYAVNKVKICQLKQWWRYQIGATYMGKSLLPAPENWYDRYSVNGKGKVRSKSPNWGNSNLPCGYFIPQLSQDISA